MQGSTLILSETEIQAANDNIKMLCDEFVTSNRSSVNAENLAIAIKKDKKIKRA